MGHSLCLALGRLPSDGPGRLPPSGGGRGGHGGGNVGSRGGSNGGGRGVVSAGVMGKVRGMCPFHPFESAARRHRQQGEGEEGGEGDEGDGDSQRQGSARSLEIGLSSRSGTSTTADESTECTPLHTGRSASNERSNDHDKGLTEGRGGRKEGLTEALLVYDSAGPLSVPTPLLAVACSMSQLESSRVVSEVRYYISNYIHYHDSLSY